MKLKKYSLNLIAGFLTLKAVAAAGPGKVEDFFPSEIDVSVKQSPLEPEKREYLKRFGVDDRTLDLFGGIYVNVPNYRADHLRWGDIKPDDLGDVRVDYDTTGMRSFAPMPPAGVHPRMFFTDADRDAHRRRLDETKGGGVGKRVLMAYTELLKGRYDREADYAKPDFYKGSFGGTHGPICQDSCPLEKTELLMLAC